MILLTYLFLLEAVVDKPRFAQASWCYQCHIASIGEVSGEQCRFFYSVAEEFWWQVAFDDKRIRLYHKYLRHYEFYVT